MSWAGGSALTLGEDQLQRRLALYSASVSLWIHQDNLLWSRLHLIIAIQAIAFTAFFALPRQAFWKVPQSHSSIMFIAALSTMPVLYFIWKDMQDRDDNVKVNNALEANIFPRDMWTLLDRRHPKDHLVKLPCGVGKSVCILTFIVGFILGADLCLAFRFWL